MKVSDVTKATDALNDVVKLQKEAMLKIIDLKIDDDMEKALVKIDAKFSEVTSQFNEVRSQFKVLDNKIDTLQKVVWGALITIVTSIIVSIIFRN